MGSDNAKSGENSILPNVRASIEKADVADAKLKIVPQGAGCVSVLASVADCTGKVTVAIAPIAGPDVAGLANHNLTATAASRDTGARVRQGTTGPRQGN